MFFLKTNLLDSFIGSTYNGNNTSIRSSMIRVYHLHRTLKYTRLIVRDHTRTLKYTRLIVRDHTRNEVVLLYEKRLICTKVQDNNL
jgi:hypothetical protein